MSTPELIAHVINLPRKMPTVLGMGAYLKATLCLIDGEKAYVTRDAGDLGTLEAVEDYQVMLDELTSLAWHPLACAAHDLHPDFHSSQVAATMDCPNLAVQHHHAHMLSTVAEHRHDGPVLGLALDGFGLGKNNAAWGGELLLVDGLEYQRLGHLAELAQPGGDIAAREPWRMAAAVLFNLGRGDEIATRYHARPHAKMLKQMLERDLNCPRTSSCGRLFDAACGLLNVLPVSEFEGQAPMALEALADSPKIMRGGWQIENGVLDFTPLLAALPDMDARAGSNLFHGTLGGGLAALVGEGAKTSGLNTLAVGGGCFFNRVMTKMLVQELTSRSITVLQPIHLSPGDAGLSFGQAIAAARYIEQSGKGESSVPGYSRQSPPPQG